VARTVALACDIVLVKLLAQGRNSRTESRAFKVQGKRCYGTVIVGLLACLARTIQE
jgi:hypothetical protein